MSGIAGIINFDGAPVEPGLVEKMTAAMSYRGPDGISHWVKGSVALGQCMLRTTPESLEENQPLTNEDESLVLVMDGRVDNWEELRKELVGRSVVLRSRADGELVLRAYETWGKECVGHIDGDFALVIWDAKRKTAFCARDRMGNKPFNYHWDGKTLVFASELHVILGLPWVSQEPNEGMLSEFLAAEWHSRDETFWLGVMRLVASHRMEVDTRGPNPERYWTPDLRTPLMYARREEYVEHYRELFSDTVRRMSRSHQVLACEVSGGLDSSAIYAMAQNLQEQHKLLAPSLEGYTLDFHDDQAANELEFAHAVGEHWGKEILKVSPANMPVSWYRDWVKHYLECPAYPNGAMGLSIRTEARSRGSRVLLAGVGGDEWLWGDRDYYAELLAASQWKLLLGSLKTDAGEAGLYKSIWWLFRFGLVPFLPERVLETLRKIVRAKNAKTADTQRWLAEPMRALLKERRKKYRAAPEAIEVPAGFGSRISMLNSAVSAHARESEERLAASAGVEIRLPFWDSKLVQFAFSTPSQLRLMGNTDRALHRQAMAGLLPEGVLTRRTKANFMITYQTGLSDLKEELTGRVAARRAGWVHPQDVAGLYNRCGRADLGWWPEWQLWTLFGCDCLADSTIKPKIN